ncbi:LytR/AlgR family response regulator transcription factor [Chitinophaga japonensis]|uniref:LytTR family two component transcriptional regulator n=1 Tax=Chitinophaga japonensis TaxID=104662 RepID=A0A562T5X3_CHIJA|nr:LytTR family DNA-binding domain-containing protein [Chitinophaga japonensis]TWI88925.1 LytTR family two component transcriptional regulator [Chitinophaga japonensis]
MHSTAPLQVLIIEDEPVTARNLQHILQEIDPAITVAAILPGVAESVNWLQQHPAACQLIFMDIRLTDGLSFEIFGQTRVEQPVIFVTAYNDYALQAFKANGIDYVLKPYDAEEISQALQKFRRFAGNGPAAGAREQVLQLMKMLQQEQPAYKQSFLVHFREKLLPLEAAQIAWFYTANEVVQACTFEHRQYTIDFTLEQLQQQLDPQLFFRANRQFIIQRRAVQEVNFFFNGRLLVRTLPEATEKILISKARVPAFKAWMNN